MSRTRWPCSLSSPARVWLNLITPPSSSMLLATMNTSRGRLVTTGGPEEDAVNDLAGRGAGVVLAELLDEAAVTLNVVGPPGLQGGQRLDELVSRAHHGSRRLVRELPVDSAFAVCVFVVVVGEEDHRTAGVGEVEHHRRVVGHEDVGGDEQWSDVRHA